MQNPDGSFTYAPNAGFYGTDTIHFIAKDGQFLTSDDFTITVTINPVVAAVVGGSSVVTGDLLANDTNPNDAIVSVTLDAAGDNTFTADGLYGELVVNANGHYTYTLGFTSAEKANLVALGDGHSAQDVFTYTISDGTVSSDANLVVDVTNHVPTISVDAVAGDNVLNALEAQSNLAISGTTSGVEDGRHEPSRSRSSTAAVTSSRATPPLPATGSLVSQRNRNAQAIALGRRQLHGDGRTSVGCGRQSGDGGDTDAEGGRDVAHDQHRGDRGRQCPQRDRSRAPTWRSAGSETGGGPNGRSRVVDRSTATVISTRCYTTTAERVAAGAVGVTSHAGDRAGRTAATR